MPVVPMKFLFVFFLAILLQAMLVAPGHAARVRFGAREELHVIAPTGLLSQGRQLSLCYKTYTYFLIAGVYTTDELVLCDGSKGRYVAMPSPEKTRQLQNDFLLPKPLPTYKRPLIDYLIGYSLWILMPFVALFSVIATRRQKAQVGTDTALLRAAVQRIMARMIACSTNSGVTIAIARETYLRMFRQPMRDEELAADVAWVRNEPGAYDGFIGAVGRKFPKPVKLSLLRLAAALVMVRGELQAGEQAAIDQLSRRLGISRKDHQAIVDSLRHPPQPGQVHRQPAR